MEEDIPKSSSSVELEEVEDASDVEEVGFISKETKQRKRSL